MNVLITGADGFIGKNLSAKLMYDGHSIIKHGLSDGDISHSGVFRYLNNTSIDHIVHLAALTYVPESWKNPYMFYTTNVIGLLNVLELCKEKGASLTFISSYLYGIPNELPINESHPLQPVNPYMLTKHIGEQMCEFYHHNFNIPVNVFRPFNIYGPGQNESFLIPKIITSAISNKIIEVFDLIPKRDYIYIDDFVELVQRSIGFINGYNVFNAGTGQSVSVKDIIDTIIGLLDEHIQLINLNKIRPNEINDVVADTTRAKSMLKWTPKTSLQEGLKKTIDSYLNNQLEHNFR